MHFKHLTNYFHSFAIIHKKYYCVISNRSPFTAYHSLFTIHYKSPQITQITQIIRGHLPFTAHRSPFTAHPSPLTLFPPKYNQ